MANTYTPDGSSYNNTHELIDGADSPSAVLLNTPVETIADNVEYLKLIVEPVGTIARLQPLVCLAGDSGSSDRIPENIVYDTGTNTWEATTPLSGNAVFSIELSNIPDRSTLTEVRVHVKGVGYTTRPSALPVMLVVARGDDFALNSLGSSTDDSADAGAFNTDHPIILTGLSQAINHTTLPTSLHMQLTYTSAGAVDGTAFLVRRVECDFVSTRATP